MPTEVTFTANQKRQIISEYRKGTLIETMTVDHSIHRVTLFKWLKKWGIPTRTDRSKHPGPKRRIHKAGTRECAKCKCWKALCEFNVDRHISDGLAVQCRTCTALKNRRNGLAFNYAITPEQYEEIRLAQNDLCAICGEPETSLLRGKYKTLSVDHCHTTGKIRGLLCGQCNRAIGQMFDNPDILEAAASYLRKHQNEQ